MVFDLISLIIITIINTDVLKNKAVIERGWKGHYLVILTKQTNKQKNDRWNKPKKKKTKQASELKRLNASKQRQANKLLFKEESKQRNILYDLKMNFKPSHSKSIYKRHIVTGRV